MNSGTLANNMTLGDDGSVTIEQYGNYVLNNLKESLEKLSGIRIDTLLSVQSLETESIDTKSLFVDELCIGGVCISSGTLQSIIESRDREPLPAQNTYNTYTTVTTEA